MAGVTITARCLTSRCCSRPSCARSADGGASVNALRFGVAFVLLVVPATAMGATLPVLVGALCRAGDGSAPRSAVSTGGTRSGPSPACWIRNRADRHRRRSRQCVGGRRAERVCGWLAMMVRLEPSAFAEAAADGISARRRPLRTCRRVFHVRAAGLPDTAARSATAAMAAPRGNRLSGTILLALEVAWFRFLSMYVLVTTLAMSLMLAVVLAGIGVGGLAASAWLRRRHERAAGCCRCSRACLGLAVAGSYAAFQATTTGTQVGEWTRVLWFASVLTLPTAVLSGALSR